MKNLNNAIDDFNAYLILYKKLALSTFQAYKHDVQTFMNYLQENEKNLESLSQEDIKLYFKSLKTKKVSSAKAIRSASALKLFVTFLRDNYGCPNLDCEIKVNNNFPVNCNEEEIKHIIANFEKAYYNVSAESGYTFQDLRNYIILYLLYISKININQLIRTTLNNLDYENRILKIFVSERCKNISLPLNFFNILQNYIKSIPHETQYLFPVKLGNDVNHISRQAVWSSIRLFLNRTAYSITLNHPSEGHTIDIEHLEVYKKGHPRS